jgi:enoyl-CoA hydratase/carnithine racemase/predicted GIY-YIG superfamily endonuclease
LRFLQGEGSGDTLSFTITVARHHAMKTYYVYIMASHRRVLYIGVSSKLEYRVWQHKQGMFPEGFSARYRAHKLVYFETYRDIVTAITREKELKGWLRSRKIGLITKANPKWKDLSKEWGTTIAPLPVRTSKASATADTRDGASPDPSLGKRRAQDDILNEDFILEEHRHFFLIRLHSKDSTNRLTRKIVCTLTKVVCGLSHKPKPLVLTGNNKFFSAGADLNEVAALSGSEAYDFAKIGQALMNVIDRFPAPVCAAIEGYCLGGGLDLALACDFRIAAPNAVFGHRGAALGLITGWGGTQRLPRLVGKGRALEMFCAAEKIDAELALKIGLINRVAGGPVREAIARLSS